MRAPRDREVRRRRSEIDSIEHLVRPRGRLVGDRRRRLHDAGLVVVLDETGLGQFRKVSMVQADTDAFPAVLALDRSLGVAVDNLVDERLERHPTVAPAQDAESETPPGMSQRVEQFGAPVGRDRLRGKPLSRVVPRT